MEGSLHAGEFLRLAYRLGREAQTGGLVVTEAAGRHLLHLRRGYLTAAQVEGHEAPLGRLLVATGVIDETQLARSLAAVASHRVLSGRALRQMGAISEPALEAALRRQAELRLDRLAAIPQGTWRFDAAAAPPPAHRSGRPFSLTTWARKHAEARLTSTRAREIVAELGSARLALRRDLCPDAVELDDCDRRVLAAMSADRRLDEIWRAAGVPKLRLLGFVSFLQAVGALDPGRAPDRARRLLGLPADADALAVKRAYRQRARQLHPDMNSDASAERRRALETELAALSEAVRALR